MNERAKNNVPCAIRTAIPDTILNNKIQVMMPLIRICECDFVVARNTPGKPEKIAFAFILISSLMRERYFPEIMRKFPAHTHIFVFSNANTNHEPWMNE